MALGAALTAFSAARRPGIYSEAALSALQQRCNRGGSVPACPATPDYDTRTAEQRAGWAAAFQPLTSLHVAVAGAADAGVASSGAPAGSMAPPPPRRPLKKPRKRPGIARARAAAAGAKAGSGSAAAPAQRGPPPEPAGLPPSELGFGRAVPRTSALGEWVLAECHRVCSALSAEPVPAGEFPGAQVRHPAALVARRELTTPARRRRCRVCRRWYCGVTPRPSFYHRRSTSSHGPRLVYAFSCSRSHQGA